MDVNTRAAQGARRPNPPPSFRQALERAFEFWPGVHLLAIQKGIDPSTDEAYKTPIPKRPWTKRPLSLAEALQFLRDGHKLGIRWGSVGMVAIDVDTKDASGERQPIGNELCAAVIAAMETSPLMSLCGSLGDWQYGGHLVFAAEGTVGNGDWMLPGYPKGQFRGTNGYTVIHDPEAFAKWVTLPGIRAILDDAPTFTEAELQTRLNPAKSNGQAGPAREAPPYDGPVATAEHVQSALKFIPVDKIGRADWILRMIEVHSWDPGERGFALWHEWSRNYQSNDADTPANYEGEDDCRANWDRAGDPRQHKPRTIGSLFHEAEERGWEKPRHTTGPGQSADQGKDSTTTPGGKTALQRALAKVLQDHNIDPALAEGAKTILPANQSAIVAALGKMLEGEYVWLPAGWHCRHGSMWKPDLEDLGVGRLGRELMECYKIKRPTVVAGIIRASAGLKGALGHTGEGWNDDPYLVGTPSGQVYSLKTGKPAPGKHRITMALGADPGDPAKAVRWVEHIKSSLPDEEAVRTWLRLWLGYCMTGETGQRLYLYAHGGGTNGKGMLLNTVQNACGGYGKSLRSDALLSHGQGQHTQNIARLSTARVVVVPDMPEGRWNTARLKALTGGDIFEVNFMRQNSFEFKPRFKLMFAGNNKPSFGRRMQHADKSRIALLDFPNTFSDDPKYETRLHEELPHIVAWLIDAAVEYCAKGLPPLPASMKAAVDDYAEQQDRTLQFAKECLSFEHPGAQTTGSALAIEWFGYLGEPAKGKRLPPFVRDGLIDPALRRDLNIEHPITYSKFTSGEFRLKYGFTGLAIRESGE